MEQLVNVKFKVDASHIKDVKEINKKTRIYVSELYKQAFEIGMEQLKQIYLPKPK